jgi:hypothetical protein
MFHSGSVCDFQESHSSLDETEGMEHDSPQVPRFSRAAAKPPLPLRAEANKYSGGKIKCATAL